MCKRPRLGILVALVLLGVTFQLRNSHLHSQAALKGEHGSGRGLNYDQPESGEEQLHVDELVFPFFIEEYIRFHEQNKLKRNAKYLVWRCPLNSLCGGAGDRIKGIVSAFYTAICTERILLIDWPLQTEDNEAEKNISTFLSPSHVDWQIPPFLYRKFKKHIGPDILFNTVDGTKNENLLNLRVPERLNDVKYIDMRSNLFVHRSDYQMNNTMCIQNLWSREPRGTSPYIDHDEHLLIRLGFWALFKFSDAVIEKKHSMQEKANVIEQSRIESCGLASNQVMLQPYIGVHIRTGIGTSWNDPSRHASKDDHKKFYDCAKTLQQGILQQQLHASTQCREKMICTYQQLNQPLPIYVAADNVIAKRALAELDAQANAAGHGSIRFLENMQIHHIDRSPKSSWNAELLVWAELVVLMEAICLVTSRSGFSDLAARLQPASKHRCAVNFSSCHDEEQVQQALASLDFGCAAPDS